MTILGQEGLKPNALSNSILPLTYPRSQFGHSFMPSLASYPNDTKMPQKLTLRVGNAIMKSYRFHVPKYNFPFRLRPVALTIFVAHVLLVCAGLTFQYAISGFWHLRVP